MSCYDPEFRAAKLAARETKGQRARYPAFTMAQLAQETCLAVNTLPFDAEPIVWSGIFKESPKQAQEELENSRRKVICALTRLLHLKDGSTGIHSAHLAGWAARLAAALGLDRAYRRDIEAAAPLHDIGKIGIPDAILNKPGALTSEEQQIIRKHPEYGWNVLRGLPGFERVSLLVLHHHERIDGEGYPAGLKGKAIPLGSRILSVIDAFDAMISARCYRAALPLDEAVRRIEAGSGTQFDPEIVSQFLPMITNDFPEISDLVKTEGFVFPEVHGFSSYWRLRAS